VGDNEEKEDKKHKVIHARVSEALEHELKKRAGNLGMSVSNLVRNILQHTVGLVEEIVEDAKIARSARETSVLGWQEAVLNINGVCEQCNAILARGTRAAIAVTDRPGRRPFLCVECLARLGEQLEGRPSGAIKLGHRTERSGS
jgi:hypothetical protein